MKVLMVTIGISSEAAKTLSLTPKPRSSQRMVSRCSGLMPTMTPSRASYRKSRLPPASSACPPTSKPGSRKRSWIQGRTWFTSTTGFPPSRPRFSASAAVLTFLWFTRCTIIGSSVSRPLYFATDRYAKTAWARPFAHPESFTPAIATASWAVRLQPPEWRHIGPWAHGAGVSTALSLSPVSQGQAPGRRPAGRQNRDQAELCRSRSRRWRWKRPLFPPCGKADRRERDPCSA